MPGSPFSEYENAFAGMTGKKPKYVRPLTAATPELPFLMAMFNPFMQSFKGIGMDPYGDQVRQLRPQGDSPSEKYGRDKAERFLKRAMDAEAAGGDDSFVELPNGSLMPRWQFNNMYRNPMHDEWKKDVRYLSGGDAAKRYRELASIYGGQ